ncbi:anthocyanidin 3-O-glucosyltransferase 6 isoform X2 [Populus alba x Populus x berolinensis]|uniref:Glycosyltransferase n=1 Tax=Populus alba x Populus x berolinensis TaxID=444605 RepID=A0AAD6VYA3_9ROSI|nr:anthocyanidin 3-O-glucosyltransferase 6 isoform X2 [Populus alba x Populus x berolinensis]
MKNAELVFIPAPIIGHFVSAVEVAKLLSERDERLSITFLVMKSSLSTKIARSYNDSVIAACGRIRFIDLPEVELDPNLPSSPDSPRLAGFVLDMFSTSIIDVANEFGVPSYIFLTSAAAFLGTTLYIQALHDEQKVDPPEFKNSDVELVMPCLASPFPAKVLPSPVLGKDLLPLCLRLFRRFREAKGIMVNTFYELESHAINSFSDAFILCSLPVFWKYGKFRCGASERDRMWIGASGHRFLWSLRQPPPNGEMEAPSDYVNPAEVLPEGFLDRTSEIGKIIGWAPQVDILAHPSIGGFVSHCGWNSTLESIWFDVPMATWPLYAEQQFNAFLMIVEFRLAIEIQVNYRMDDCEIVRAGEIEKGIRGLMEFDIKKREKLKEISENSRKALMKDGSSSTWLDRVIQDMIDNMP